MQALGDLFCSLYNALDDDAVAADGARWLESQFLNSLSESVTSDVLAGRPVAAIATRINSGDDAEARRFAGLRGIDRALEHINPRTRRPGMETPSSLAPLEAHVARHHRLDSGQHGGALLLRLVHPGRPPGDPSHKRDLFGSVIRVPAESWDRCHVHALEESLVIDWRESRSGIVVACVPVIVDPDELFWDIRETRVRRYYRIGPADSAITQRRIVEIVAKLDRSGALIAVAPELTLSPLILERWKEVLRARDRRGSRLRWVLVGTGNLNPARRPSNTAVLLDARTGAEIARQDKHFPFNFDSAELERWKLPDRLGAEPIAEDLAPGRRLTVLDAGSFRVAMVICEDLDRTMDIGPVIRDMGISLILTPVFSRPLKLDRWEHKAAATHLRETGATVVISNSRVVGSLTGSDGGTALVLPSDERATIRRSAGPAEPVCFRVKADGSAEAC